MQIILVILSLPYLYRWFLYIYNMSLVAKFLKQDVKTDYSGSKKNMLILIPVLREQSVIKETIQHFTKMHINNINMHLVIAGTKRELKSDDSTTIEVVEQWIQEYKQLLPDNIEVDYCEAEDDDGDRATQLNYGVQYIKQKKNLELHYIGVYDADSLPSLNTLAEVANAFSEEGELCACQQPVHFIRAANRMASNKANPLLVANALYQTTWMIISELPMWVKYYCKADKNISKRHIYLIGHGEFMTNDVYENFKFPEYEVTDGIQLGYRLGMANKKVKPLHEFCNDDVPQSLKSLINQHKRWFGGCMNLLSGYEWAKKHYKINPFFQVLDGFWSQARWAWTSISYLIILLMMYFNSSTMFITFLCVGIIYCYIFPIISHKILKVKIKVRIIDWICLPIAIFIKSIGPNIYIINKIFRLNIKYEKVER